MATQTQYYNLDKPSYDEVADIEVINANMDKIDQQMRNNADGVTFAKGISSDAYDNSKLYAVGDYCIYENKLYRCITAIESAEAFNVAKWEQTTVGKEVKQLNSNLVQLEYGENSGNKNLFDEKYTDIKQSTVTLKPIYVGDGDFTLSTDIPLDGGSANVFLVSGNVPSYSVTTSNDGAYSGNSKTVQSNNGYVTIGYRIQNYSPLSYHTQLEKGTTATPYEPYIPSVKMLADEVNAQNDSLDEHGLLNKFNGNVQIGFIDKTNGRFNSDSKNKTTDYYTCVAGDVIYVDNSKSYLSNKWILIVFCNDSSITPISFKESMDGKIVVTAPENATRYIVSCTSDVSNLFITVNNEIEQLKNDLGGLSFSASGTTLTITDGTNTWTMTAN